MAFLGFILRTLYWLTRLSGGNVFTFDRCKRVFRVNKVILLVVRILHYFCIIPTLVLALTFYAFFVGKYVWDMLVTGVQGDESARGLLMLLSIGLLCRMNFLIAYTVYTINCRLNKLLRLCNNFVSAYDQCTCLFGSKLRLHWTPCAIVCVKLILVEALPYPFLLGKDLEILYLLIIFSMQPLLLTLTSLVALMLLHGLLRTATLKGQESHILWQQPLTQKKAAKLIQLYCTLLTLRRDLEPYLRAFSASEIGGGIIWIILFYYEAIYKSMGTTYLMTVCILPLLYPVLVSHYAHDIGIIAEKLGDELLTLDGAYVAGAASKMVELFCLHKLLMETVQDSSRKILYLRRSFILMIVDFTFVNTMFIASLLATADEHTLRSA